MNKKDLKSRLIPAENFLDYTKYRIPSGIFVLDLLLGGGLPLWKFNIIFGKESSGKTTQSLRFMGQFQKLYPKMKLLYIDIEHSFDKIWAQNLIDLKQTIISQPHYGEEAVDIVINALEDKNIGALLVDSLAMLVPVLDANKSAMEDSVGSLPKLVNKFIRKLIPIVADRKNENIPLFLILLNHLTANTEARGFQSPYKKIGGMFQNQIATVDIQFYTKGYKELKGIPVAVTHQFTINKAKITGALPKRSGEFTIALVDHNGFKQCEVLDHEQVIAFGRKVNVIQQDKTWKVLNKSFQTLADLLSYLQTDKKFFEQVKEKVLQECLKDLWSSSE